MESSIIEARSIMQNHIDKQYDIMEENKRSLRRQLDKRRNESESKHSATSSEEESTEEKEGSDTTLLSIAKMRNYHPWGMAIE